MNKDTAFDFGVQTTVKTETIVLLSIGIAVAGMMIVLASLIAKK